jgi:signal transduction histidine kinase
LSALPVQHGVSPDEVASAVHQMVAEVRRRNALVVAWVRMALLCALLGFTLHAWQLDPRLGLNLLVQGLHLGFAVAAAAALHRRTRTTAVALSASSIDLVVLVWSGLQGTAAGAPVAEMGMAVAFLGGLMQLVLLFGAVSLPARALAPLVGAALVAQAWLALRAELPLAYVVVATLTAAAFAVVVLWTGLRMVRLAADGALEEMTAAVAERHAAALEAANAQVAAQRDRLVRAQNEAEILTQVIVHDLKNPLATMLQYVSLAEGELRDLTGGEPSVAFLKHANEEGRRLAKLIGDLLLLNRLEQGGMTPRREAVPLPLLLEGVRRAYKLRAGERGVTLEVEGDADLLVLVDLDLVQRLVENLVANALRHVGRGDRIALEARGDGERVVLAVRNTGSPVPADMRDKLFERYVSEGPREWHNAGLGLYLCRLVAEAHGGRITLVERAGWNVSFEVSVPLVVAAAAEAPLASAGG